MKSVNNLVDVVIPKKPIQQRSNTSSPADFLANRSPGSSLGNTSGLNTPQMAGTVLPAAHLPSPPDIDLYQGAVLSPPGSRYTLQFMVEMKSDQWTDIITVCDVEIWFLVALGMFIGRIGSLREGQVFSRVCLSGCTKERPCDHHPWCHCSVRDSPLPPTCSNMFTWDLLPPLDLFRLVHLDPHLPTCWQAGG